MQKLISLLGSSRLTAGAPVCHKARKLFSQMLNESWQNKCTCIDMNRFWNSRLSRKKSFFLESSTFHSLKTCCFFHVYILEVGNCCLAAFKITIFSDANQHVLLGFLSLLWCCGRVTKHAKKTLQRLQRPATRSLYNVTLSRLKI